MARTWLESKSVFFGQKNPDFGTKISVRRPFGLDKVAFVSNFLGGRGSPLPIPGKSLFRFNDRTQGDGGGWGNCSRRRCCESVVAAVGRGDIAGEVDAGKTRDQG